MPFRDAKQTRRRVLSLGFIPLLAALLFLFPVLSRAQAAPPEKEREPLGSLTSAGEVFVNDSPASAEITIFSGDKVRTGESGSATFNMSGKGSLKISPRSEVLFSGKYEYTAEFETGAVLLSSVSGSNGFTLRVGSDVVVPSFKAHIASAWIAKAPDGSYLVKCSDGAMGILALQGSSGQFIEAGQSLSVAANGALFAVAEPGAARGTTTSLALARPHKPSRSSADWAYLALGGALASGLVLGLSHGGGKQSISPAAP